jgi:hypothetical protein
VSRIEEISYYHIGIWLGGNIIKIDEFPTGGIGNNSIIYRIGLVGKTILSSPQTVSP